MSANVWLKVKKRHGTGWCISGENDAFRFTICQEVILGKIWVRPEYISRNGQFRGTFHPQHLLDLTHSRDNFRGLQKLLQSGHPMSVYIMLQMIETSITRFN